MGEEVPEPVVAVAQPKLVTKKQKSPQLVAVTSAPVVVHEHLEVDVDNVQVTEDDLKDPTLLAELRALGIEGDDDVADGAEDAVAQEETQGVIQDSVNETVDALDTNEAEKVPEDDGYLPLQEKLKCNDPAVLEKYIKLERMRALSFKRENNISAAKQAYDGSKKLQEKLDSILNLRNAPGNDHMQKREIAIQRANEYKKAALNAKIAGNITKAKEFLLSSKVIDDLLRKFDSGVSVDWSQMPPPIQEATNIPSSIPAPALKVPASVVKVEKRKLSGTKKVSLPEMEATVENYQDALKLLVTQVDKAKKYAKLFLVQGDLERSKRLDEISAIFTRDIATLKASKQAFSVRSLDLEFVVEDINDDIALNEMSISVIKGLGLVCKEVALGADLNCFVKWDVAWPPPDKPQSHLSKGETDKVFFKYWNLIARVEE
jgi:soluble cytochrome b562